MFFEVQQAMAFPPERGQGRNKLGNNKCSAYRQHPGRGADMEEK